MCFLRDEQVEGAPVPRHNRGSQSYAVMGSDPTLPPIATQSIDEVRAPPIEGPAMQHELLRNYIDGEWVDASSGQTIDNVNPADTRQVIGQVVRATKEDAKRAVAAAKRAFETWRKV